MGCIQNPNKRVTDDDKSSLTGKDPLAKCVMSHFSASQFLAIRRAVAILKTSCEDVLLTQVEIRQRNDQTLQTPHKTVCKKKRKKKAMQHTFEFPATAVKVLLCFLQFLRLFYCSEATQT